MQALDLKKYFFYVLSYRRLIQYGWIVRIIFIHRYLQEVGYTDTILDVKSKRVRALLGFSSDVTDREDDKNQDSLINGTEGEVKDTAMIG